MEVSFTLVAGSLIVVLFFGILFAVCYPETEDWDGIEDEDDDTFWKKIFNRIYMSVSIASAAGLGQMKPKPLGARFLVGLEMVVILTGIIRILTARNLPVGTYF